MDDFEFYVEKTVSETGAHIVHKASCSSLPGIDTLYHMGVRSTSEASLKEADNWFPGAAPCPVCMGS